MLEEKDAFERMGEELGIVDPEPKEEEIVEEEDEETTEEESEDEETDEPEDDEEEEGDDEDDEDEPEEEEDETSKKKPKPKVSIYKKYNDLRSELRETNRKLEQLAQGKPAQQKEEESDDDSYFRELAIRLTGADAEEEKILGTIEQLKIITEATSKRNSLGLTPAQIQKLKDDLENKQEDEQFKSEWEEIEDVLTDDFKGATKEQMRLAKKAMDDLSHAPQFANKELSTVYLKNRSIFNQIFKSKPSHSFESRDTYHETREEKSDLEEKYKGKKSSEIPEKDLLDMFDKMEKDARRMDDEDGWNITNPDD